MQVERMFAMVLIFAAFGVAVTEVPETPLLPPPAKVVDVRQGQ